MDDITSVPEDDTSRKLKIVAIGASAGGLEPLETFFEAMPVASGVAFVVIQHLAPDFRSMMNELLARHSEMPIYKVLDGMPVEANAIYLNPPGSDMVLAGGVFRLQPAVRRGGVNLPINKFFESLARECGPNAIGIVLSGTGTDGSKGCLAIKANGGVVLVQEPASSKFDGMPSSVIGQDLADGIAEPRTLAAYVIRHVSGKSLKSVRGSGNKGFSDPLFTVLYFLRERFGVDFNSYKRATIERRVRRRCEISQIQDLENYADYLSSDPNELTTLYNDLLIDVTAFFRDSEAFLILKNNVIPALAEVMLPERDLRVWVPGCASGEEAYSIAILIAEHARLNRLPLNLKILATDLHSSSLDIAGTGCYPEEALKGMDPELVERYFDRNDDVYQIKSSIRRLIVFSPHNLISDPPFTRIDLISCRNLLIYFNDETQRRVLTLFHFALSKGGYLFLGPSESVGKLGSEFNTINQRWRIFMKARDVLLRDSTALLLRSGLEQSGNRQPVPATSQETPLRRPEVRRAYNDALSEMLSRYAPAGFLIRTDASLVHIFGDAASFLNIEQGYFSQKISDLLQPHLRVLVNSCLERIRTLGYVSGCRTMSKQSGAEDFDYITSIDPLPDADGSVDYLLLIIEKQPKPDSRDEAPDMTPEEMLSSPESATYLESRIKNLEDELQSTEENLQSTIEELATSNEELQATNEELMASNEELQSTNEELHSVNEELYMVSAEHQRKIEELTELTNDMDHLLKATEIGTIFLDHDLSIRRFTPAVTRTFNVLTHDIGRPISHVTFRFDAEDFVNSLLLVRDTGDAFEQQVQVDGYDYLLRVLPYATDGQEHGLVITVIDVNELKKAQRRNKALVEKYDRILTDIPQPIVCWRAPDGVVTYCNEPFAQSVQRGRDEIVGTRYVDLVTAAGAPAHVNADLVAALTAGETRRFEVDYVDGNGVKRWQDVHYRAVLTGEEQDLQYLGTVTDITERNAATLALEKANEDLKHANEGLKKFAYIASHDLQEPLRKIQQFSDLLSEEYGGKLTQEADFYMGVMRDAAKRMSRLIRDLLAYSKASNTEIVAKPINLVEVVERVVSNLDLVISETGAVVKIGKLPIVEGDETLVEQVILNLISNAIKYHRAETAPVVKISAFKAKGYTGFQVADNGAGIDEADKERIFDAFSRLQPNEAIAGTGIGLAICRAVCDRHNWKLSVDSQYGKGSVFRVEIPK